MNVGSEIILKMHVCVPLLRYFYYTSFFFTTAKKVIGVKVCGYAGRGQRKVWMGCVNEDMVKKE